MVNYILPSWSFQSGLDKRSLRGIYLAIILNRSWKLSEVKGSKNEWIHFFCFFQLHFSPFFWQNYLRQFIFSLHLVSVILYCLARLFPLSFFNRFFFFHLHLSPASSSHCPIMSFFYSGPFLLFMSVSISRKSLPFKKNAIWLNQNHIQIFIQLNVVYSTIQFVDIFLVKGFSHSYLHNVFS